MFNYYLLFITVITEIRVFCRLYDIINCDLFSVPTYYRYGAQRLPICVKSQ